MGYLIVYFWLILQLGLCAFIVGKKKSLEILECKYQLTTLLLIILCVHVVYSYSILCIYYNIKCIFYRVLSIYYCFCCIPYTIRCIHYGIKSVVNTENFLGHRSGSSAM